MRQLPDSWQQGQLGQFFETTTGSTPSKKEKQYYGTDIPFVKPPELQSGFITKTVDNLSHDGAAVARVLPPNSVLVSCIGNLGKVGLNTVPVAFNQQINAIIPNENTISEFMFYQVLSPNFTEQLHNLASGTTVPIVNKSKFNSIDVVLPPLPEQKRIVAILDESFAGISQAVAYAEKNLTNARELFESYRNNVFAHKGEGWAEKSLGDICDFLNGFAFKSIDSVDESNTQLVRMGNLYKNVLDLDRKPSFYPDDFEEKYTRYVLSGGDLIMSLTGTVGKEDYGFTVEIPETDRVLLLNQRIVKFINISEDQIDRRYFLHFLRSRRFMKELYESSRGVRQANLSSISMKKLSVVFPEIEEQKHFVQRFDALETDIKILDSIYQKKLIALAELKQSILQKAFAGELNTDELPKQAIG